MTGAALVLSVVDTCTEEMHLVAVEMAALHRRSGCYPALCGTLVAAASLATPPARQCSNCAKQAHRRGEGENLQRKPIRSYRTFFPWPGRGGRHRARDT